MSTSSDLPAGKEIRGLGIASWLRLSPDIHVTCGVDGWALISERGALQIGGVPDVVGAILSALQNGVWLRDLARLASAPVLGRILVELIERQWLVGEPDTYVPAQFHQVTGWLSSLTAEPVAALTRLERATVAIIGVGGLGSQVAEHLAGVGVGGFVLIDGDKVDPTNFNRQYMYDHSSAGRRKVEVAGEQIWSRNPAARIESLPFFVYSTEELKCLDSLQVQLVINCADQPNGIDAFVAAYCERRSISFITAGVGLHRGYWGPFLTQQHTQGLKSCEARLRRMQGSTVAAWNKAVICTSSHGPYNSIIAGHVAADAIAYLSQVAEPQSLRKRLFFDFDRLAVTAVSADDGTASFG